MSTQEPFPFDTTAASAGPDNGAAGASLSGEPLTSAWQAFINARQATYDPNPEMVLTLDLPSGMKVKARRVHLMTLFTHGSIPDALSPIVNKFLASAQTGLDTYLDQTVAEVEQDPNAAVERFLSLMHVVWVNAVDEPVFSVNPATGPKDADGRPLSFPVSAVPLDDLLYLFEWCQGVTASLANFRERQELLVSAAQEGEDLRSLAVRFARDRPAEGELVGVADQRELLPVG